ncbi:hypothetical protein Tco_0535237 [Tanacetum coccineum]
MVTEGIVFPRDIKYAKSGLELIRLKSKTLKNLDPVLNELNWSLKKRLPVLSFSEECFVFRFKTLKENLTEELLIFNCCSSNNGGLCLLKLMAMLSDFAIGAKSSGQRKNNTSNLYTLQARPRKRELKRHYTTTEKELLAVVSMPVEKLSIHILVMSKSKLELIRLAADHLSQDWKNPPPRQGSRNNEINESFPLETHVQSIALTDDRTHGFADFAN